MFGTTVQMLEWGVGGYVVMMVINTITPSQLKGNKQYIYGYGYY